MNTVVNDLESHFRRISRISHAETFLAWDQLVMMPVSGGSRRSEAMAELATLRHEWLTDSRLGDWLDEAEQLSADADPAMRSSVREMRRVWREASCLTPELVRAQVLATGRCERGWREQKPRDDWDGFAVNFREVVDLSREEAAMRLDAAGGAIATGYEAMLDLHCHGESLPMVEQVFADLLAVLPDLLQQVVESQQGNRAQLRGEFEPARQQQLCGRLASYLGFEVSQGRLDSSLHPFSTGEAGDLRITTRYKRDDLLDALLSTAHEIGHARYEGGLPEQLAGLPVGGSRNMSIHESQSLLFEKHLMQSLPFLNLFASDVEQEFPALVPLSGPDLWNSCHRVEPGFIRIEADEICYPMHVALRFEIERDLINGALTVDDVPERWNTSMQKNLGISPGKQHSLGCMQDIHWSEGAFGYFPAYTLGAVNAAQLASSLREAHPQWQSHFAEGDLEFVFDWLQQHIWSAASLQSSQELMQRVTGSATDASFLLEHLQARYVEERY